MTGIKIRKTLREGNTTTWPKGYRLDGIIAPIGSELAKLWWITQRAQYAFPPEWILEEFNQPNAPKQGLMDGIRFQEFDAQFVPHANGRIAKPGFLPRFAEVVSGDWTVLGGVVENPSGNDALLEALDSHDWFAPSNLLPLEVSILIRGIDWAYWEIFARDSNLITALDSHLRAVTGLEVSRIASDPP